MFARQPHHHKILHNKASKTIRKNTFGGDRTHGQQLKRLSLYRLSYEGSLRNDFADVGIHLNTVHVTNVDIHLILHS